MCGKGRFWSILGGLGGVLGALGAVRRSEICFQDRFLRKEDGRRRQKRPQDAPRGVKGAQKAPQSFQNEPQRVQNWELKVLKRVLGRNIRKTSKSTTASSENVDFGGTEGRKLTEN